MSDRKYKVLDGLWSRLVEMRARGRCEKCGAIHGLSAHHIFGRRMLSVRWDKECGVYLCLNCHTASSIFSAHLTPNKFMEWIIEHRGAKRIDALTLRANTPGKPDEIETKIILNTEIDGQRQFYNK